MIDTVTNRHLHLARNTHRQRLAGATCEKHRPTSTRNMDHWRNSRQFDRISMGTKHEQFDMRELILTKNRRFCTPPPTCAASLLGSLLFELAVSCRGRFAHTRAVPINGTGKGGHMGTCISYTCRERICELRKRRIQRMHDSPDTNSYH